MNSGIMNSRPCACEVASRYRFPTQDHFASLIISLSAEGVVADQSVSVEVDPEYGTIHIE